MSNTLCVADNAQNQLVIVDVDAMTTLRSVAVGREPYPVDAIGSDLVLVSTRGVQSIQPVRVSSGIGLSPVGLKHTPRSTTRHPDQPIALISGGDRAYTTVLDTTTLRAIAVVGSGSHDSRRDFGGGLACGHPAWGPNDTFLHLDRIARRLELYGMDGNLVTSVNLPSSPHHVTKTNECYLALCEGNPQSRINPSVLRFRIEGNRVVVDAHRFLPIPPMHEAETGAHHLTYDNNS